MPFAEADGVRLYYEQRGEGPPILGIHGGGSSARLWEDAAERLAELGRVIVYDRRGCDRSERPEPYVRTTISEQVGDALAVLDAAEAPSALVIGRSLGGWIAHELARRHPERVSGLVLLEPDAPGLSPLSVEWIADLRRRMEAVAEREGAEAVPECVIDEVAGEGSWASFPPDVRAVLAANGPALLAELHSFEGDHAGADELAAIGQPTLVVMAEESAPPLSDPGERLAEVLPDARTVEARGGHMIDPAGPEVRTFAAAVLAR